MTWFIFILIAFILVALTWSYFGEIEDYVSATGSVRPGDKISTISNVISGRVDKVNIEEGARVKEGDVLYTIEMNSVLIDKAEKGSQVAKFEKENINLLKFKKSIQEGINLFNKDDIDESSFYFRFQRYLTDSKTNVEQKNTAEVKLQDQNKFLESIGKNKDLFEPNNADQHSRYGDYVFNIEKLKSVYKQKNDTYTRLKMLYDGGVVANIEVEDSENQFVMAKLELDKFKNEFEMNLLDGIKQSTQSIQELSAKDPRIDTSIQIEDSLTSNGTNLDKVKSELTSLELNIKEATVTSPIEGIVNLYTEINHGDLLQSGSEIAVIVPDTSTANRIQLIVSNKDIANIKEGQKIKYHFTALPYREYGELEGIVTKVGTDARVDKASGVSYYTAEATVENKELESYKGVKAQIKVGMVCEAQVVTKSRKILLWLLEKINLIN